MASIISDIPSWLGRQEYYALLCVIIFYATTTFIVNIAQVFPQIRRLVMKVLLAPIVFAFWISEKIKIKEI